MIALIIINLPPRSHRGHRSRTPRGRDRRHVPGSHAPQLVADERGRGGLHGGVHEHFEHGPDEQVFVVGGPQRRRYRRVGLRERACGERYADSESDVRVRDGRGSGGEDNNVGGCRFWEGLVVLVVVEGIDGGNLDPVCEIRFL